MSVMRAAILGVAGALLAIQFKNKNPEYGIYISIALSILISFGILKNLALLIENIKHIASYIHLDNVYLSTLVKMLGITYIAEFSSNICKDAGYQTIAKQIEIFGKLIVLVLGMPVLMMLLDLIGDFLT